MHLDKMIPRINSGDPENYEGQAAAIYWNYLLKDYGVTRGRDMGSPNHLFNYGYAILRAVIARNLVGSGCLPVLGIHHTNKYNAYCLADDIMEPFRPIVDKMVVEYLEFNKNIGDDLTKEDKAYLLQIPATDIMYRRKNESADGGCPTDYGQSGQMLSGHRQKNYLSRFIMLNPTQ
jgi:CRISPR-associated protein Cas1